MGIFSKFENKMEDGLEGAAGKIFNAPISPVQISKKAEKAMRREKMVGAGKQYAPTLYTVLVNAEDDKSLFGYYPTLAGETETYLTARAAEEGLTMDGQPLVRFIVDESLKHGKFDVVAELVSAPIVAQLRREEMQRYGLLGKASTPQAQAVSGQQASQQAQAYTQQQAQAYAQAQAKEQLRNSVPLPESAPEEGANVHYSQPYAQRLEQSQTTPADLADPAEEVAPKKQPLPYVPEEEIDRSIDYGEYTFNSQDFEDYEEHGPSAQLIHPAGASASAPSSTPSASLVDPMPAYEGSLVAEQQGGEDFNSLADLSGFDVEAYNPYSHDSRDFYQSKARQASAAVQAAPAAVPTQVFAGGAAVPEPNHGAVRARLINTATNRDYNLVGGRLILGRSRSCDISIDDINLSRSHAELRFETQGVWVLTDLGSTNGTKVNNERITSHSLNSGDRITVGTTTLLFLEG